MAKKVSSTHEVQDGGEIVRSLTVDTYLQKTIDPKTMNYV